MKTVRACFRLPPATRMLALEAALGILLARMLVARVPLRYWRHRLETAPQPLPVPANRAGAQLKLARELSRIVRRTARHAPFRALCLPRAIAAQWMLRRRGVRSRLVFGVRRSAAPDPALEFHAWLIAAGEIVMGARGADTCSPLPAPGAPGRRMLAMFRGTRRP